MDPSPIGKTGLIAHEGRRLRACREAVKVWTIGIGYTQIDGRPIRSGAVITAAECDALFDATWPTYAAAVAKLVSAGIGLARHAACSCMR